MNPYQRYQQQSVMTMTKGEMLLKLYDEVIKQLSAAVMHMDNMNYADVNTALQKSQKILNYLKSTLDFKYEVSNNLSALYDYFMEQIVQSNVKKESAALTEIITMIAELRESFAKADKNARIK